MAAADEKPVTEKPAMLTRFSKPWKNSDVVLLVDGEEFHTHLHMLEWSSPVLSAMFSGSFKEGNDMRAELPGKDKIVFSYLLHFIYPIQPGNEGHKLAMVFLVRVLEYCEEYMMEGVKGRIDQVLSIRLGWMKRNEAACNPCFKLYVVADKFKLEATRTSCLKVFSYLNRGHDYHLEKADVDKLTPQARLDLVAVEAKKLGISKDSQYPIKIKEINICESVKLGMLLDI